MNRIKKAMLAFAIFGFFGGCEAANVVYIKSRGQEIGNVQNERRLQIYNIVHGGNRTKGNHLEYNVAYQNIINAVFGKLLEKQKSGTQLDENIVCKALIKLFLLDDISSNDYGINAQNDVRLIDNIRKIFFWHVEKHFFDFDKRYSNGNIHTRVQIQKNVLSERAGKLVEIGELTMKASHYNALTKILKHVIEKCTFYIDGNQIKVRDFKLDDILKNDIFKDACLYEHEIRDNKIQKNNTLISRGIAMINSLQQFYFFFHLRNAVDINRFKLTNVKDNDLGDTSFGSFYFSR